MSQVLVMTHVHILHITLTLRIDQMTPEIRVVPTLAEL